MAVSGDQVYELWKDKMPKMVETFDSLGAKLVGSVEYQGTKFPAAPGAVETLLSSLDFKARADDVFIAGFPKAGAHWAWDIVHMVMNGSAGKVTSTKDDFFFESFSPEHNNALPSPRVFDTHLPVKLISKDIFDKNVPVIFLLRNPKDSAVSMYNHFKGITVYEYDGVWEGFFPLFLSGNIEYGSWFDHTRDWWEFAKNHSNVLVLKYEDMSKDLSQAVRSVAKLLKRDLSEELIHEISDECQFHKMKVRKQDVEHNVWKKPEQSMYRKGKVGDWKSWFTVAQNEQMDAMIKEKFAGTDLEFQYEI